MCVKNSQSLTELVGYYFVLSHPTDIVLYFHYVCFCHYMRVCVCVEVGMVDFQNFSNRVNPLFLRNVLCSHRELTEYRHKAASE